MAASVSNIVQAVPLDSAITLAAVGPGTDAFQDQFTTDAGIDSNGCLTLTNQTASYSAGVYTAHGSFSAGPYDLSQPDQAFIVHFNNIGGAGFTTIAAAADGFQVLFFSGGSTANWASYHFDPRAPSVLNNQLFHALICHGTPDATGGSWDATDVDGYGFAVNSGAGIAFQLWFKVDQMLYVNGPVIFGDTNSDPVGLADYAVLFDPQSGSPQTYHTSAVIRAGTTYEFPFPVDIQARNYTDATVTSALAFKADDTGFTRALTDYYSLGLTAPASGSQVYDNFSAYSLASDFDLTVDSTATSSSIDIANANFSSLNDVVLDGSGVTAGNTTFVNPATFDIQDGDFDITVTGVVAAIQWTGDLATGSVVRTDSDVDVTFDVGDYSDVSWVFTASNDVTVDPVTNTGEYDFSTWVNSGFTTNFDIPSGNTNDTTITLGSGFTATRTDPTTGGGEITLAVPTSDLTIDSNVTATITVFSTGTQTVLATATGTQLVFTHSGQTVDYTIAAAGYYAQRFTGVVLSGTVDVQVALVAEPFYNAGHALTYTADASHDRAANRLSVPSFGPTGQDIWSLMSEEWATRTALRNTEFPYQLNGAGSLFLRNGCEGASDADIANISRAGVRYVSVAGATTAEWVGVLSVGAIPGGTTCEYQQTAGSGTTDARATGVFDQTVKTYGDATHGNFDYRTDLVCKSQPNGYYEARVDIPSAYGVSALDPRLYVVALEPQAISGFTVGDPGITVTLVDHTAAPITVGGEQFSWELQVGASVTSAQVQRDLNFYKSGDATSAEYLSLDPFNLPDWVRKTGDVYTTERFYVEGEAGFQGLYVSRSGGDHPGFTSFMADNGNVYTPVDTVSWAAGALLDDSRVRLYNETSATELDNSVVSGGAGYGYVLIPGVDFTPGDQITMIATYQQGGVAKEVFRFSTVVTTADVIINDAQVDWDEPNVLAIDGATVSECTTDYLNIEVEIDDVDNTTQKARIAAFIVDAITTEDGIRNWVSLAGNPVITYTTATAAQVDASLAAVAVVNAKASSTLYVQDSFEFDWSDGVDRVSAVLGSSIVWLTPARVYTVAVGSAVTAQDKVDIANEVHNKTVENSESFIEIVRLLRAAMVGQNAKTNASPPFDIVFRDAADTKDRITASVNASGERTSVTVDAS